MHPVVSVSAASISQPEPEGDGARGVPVDRLRALVEAHYTAAWRVLRRFGLSPADADDGAQQVFLVAAGRLADILPGKERAFLFRTALHVASKAHRARRRRPEDADAECGESADHGPSADELVERSRARALLDGILAQMPVELSAVIVLFEIEGLTMAEIAEVLEVPPGTVASRLRRGREELAARVARHAERTFTGGSVR
jgi:RNA polymerase sigma-70 factor (ECF subfamily)